MKQGIAVASFILAAFISITALFLPPQGIIDYSVLVLIAQLLILVCTIIGVKLPNVIKKD